MSHSMLLCDCVETTDSFFAWLDVSLVTIGLLFVLDGFFGGGDMFDRGYSLSFCGVDRFVLDFLLPFVDLAGSLL